MNGTVKQIFVDWRQVYVGCLLSIVKGLKNSKETYDLNHIYKMDIDKACFAHDGTYADSKDLFDY